MDRTVLRLFPALETDVHLIARLGSTEVVRKTLKDIVDRQRRRMNEVIGIEPIVAEFIEHYFECFEIDRLRL